MSDISHADKVKLLQKELREKGRVSLKKTVNSNTLRNGGYKKKAAALDLSDFDELLKINQQEGWAWIEPRMTFKTLCDHTLRHGLVPPVVPEFMSITVGGAVMGAALESSSHKFGQVSDTCLEYEVLLGNGELVVASPQTLPDLFYGLSGSYGTLGLLTAVKIRLIPAKKWVHLKYHSFKNLKEAVLFLTSPHLDDYVEGIAFNRSHAVAVLGNLSDEQKAPVFSQKHWWSQWYAQHLAHCRESEECMLLEEYLFRFDRGAFWMGKYIHSFSTMIQLALRLIPSVKEHSLNPSFLFRFLFGWAFTSQKLYRLWHKVPGTIAENLFFIHDFYTPSSKAFEALKQFMTMTEIFPIWLCPIRGAKSPQLFSPHYGEGDFLNIGIYGMPHTDLAAPLLSQELEKKILEYGGRKMLYSFTYYDKETFSKAYFADRYAELRRTYGAEKAFPPLYSKVTNIVDSAQNDSL